MPLTDDDEQIPATGKLSGREIQIFKLIAHGQTGPQIAVELNISPHTVKKHREHLLHKFGACNTAQMIEKAHLSGLL